MQDTRKERMLLFVPPGRQARFYMEGLFIAAQRLGVGCERVDLAELWRKLPPGRSSPAMIRDAADRMRGLIADRGITHTLGYADSAAFDLGFTSHGGRPRTFWADQGVTSMHLWTDHPNWSASGGCMRSPERELLADPSHVHFLKSRSAADEAREVLGWRRVHELAMAEEPGLAGFDADPRRPSVSNDGPRYDAVAIVGAALPIPPWLEPYLGDDAVTLDALVRANAEAALASWETWIASTGVDDGLDLSGLGGAWIEAKARSPLATLWDLAGPLRDGFEHELEWLAADASRWYGAVRALQTASGGLRSFWLGWLGRRVRLGVFGTDATHLGIEQSPQQKQWVRYEHQAAVYRLGACAININQSHDEQGVTHKPFQIVASGVPAVHAATDGLGDLFRTEPGPDHADRELAAFRTGPELLAAVRSLADDPGLRQRRSAAAYERLLAEHRWEHRLERMLDRAASSAASSDGPPAASPACVRPSVAVSPAAALAT